MKAGQERTKKWSAGMETLGGVWDVIEPVDDFISDSLSGIPQAAGAWMAVTFVLKVINANASYLERPGEQRI